MSFDATSLLSTAHDEMVERLAAITTLNDAQRQHILQIVEEEIRRANPGGISNALGGTGGMLGQVIHFIMSLFGMDPNRTGSQQVDEQQIDAAMQNAFLRMTSGEEPIEIREAATIVTGLNPTQGRRVDGEYAAAGAAIHGRPTMDNSVVGALKQAALDLSRITDPQDTAGPEGSVPPVTSETVVAQAPAPAGQAPAQG